MDKNEKISFNSGDLVVTEKSYTGTFSVGDILILDRLYANCVANTTKREWWAKRIRHDDMREPSFVIFAEEFRPITKLERVLYA